MNLTSQNQRLKILLIDDDEGFRGALSRLLAKDYDVSQAAGGEQGLSLAVEILPGLIILDLEMPDTDGISVCTRLRENPKTAEIPIIMMTGHDVSRLRIEAFEAGVDDFLPKPFIGAELVARIQAKLRRKSGVETSTGTLEIRRCGNLVAEIASMRVSVAGKPVELSTLEFKLLLILLENKDRILSREQILDSIWKNTSVSIRTVDTHMSLLRKKLVDFDHTISSKYGSGYMLTQQEGTPNARES